MGQIPAKLPNIARNPANVALVGLTTGFQRCAANASAGAANRMIIIPTLLDARSELAPGKSLLIRGQALIPLDERLKIIMNAITQSH